MKNFNILRHCVSALMLVILCVTARAYDFAENGLHFTISGNNEVSLAFSGTPLGYESPDGKGSPVFNNSDLNFVDDSGVLTVPATITHDGIEYNVTGIGSKALFYYDNILSVSLPEGLKHIEDEAFVNCSNLCEINFPSTLETIGTAAFARCKMPETLVIPKNVTSLGDFAFSGIGSTKLVCEANVTFFPGQLFSSSENLKEISIISPIERMEDGVFSGCNNIQSLDLPSTLKELGVSSFSSYFDKNPLPSSIEKLAEGAVGPLHFINATAMTSLPDGFCKSFKDLSQTIKHRDIIYQPAIILSKENADLLRIEGNSEFLKTRTFISISTDMPERTLYAAIDPYYTSEVSRYIEIPSDAVLCVDNDTQLMLAFAESATVAKDPKIFVDENIVAEEEMKSMFDNDMLWGKYCVVKPSGKNIDIRIDYTTGVNNITETSADIPATFNIYSICGSMVATDADINVLQTLPKGIYIISNGKTTFKKIL